MRRTLLAAALVIGATAAPAQAPRPVIDVHIHYSHDTWSVLPPPEAIKVLRQAGLQEGVRVELQRRRHADALQGRAGPDRAGAAPLSPPRRDSAPGRGTRASSPTSRPAQGQHLRRHRRVPRLRCRRRHARDAAHGAARQGAQDLPARPLRRRRRGAHLQAEPRGAGAVGALGLRAGRQGARHGRPSTRRCGPTSPSAATRRPPASSTPRGASCSSTSPSASWWAPTPTRPSAGTTWSSTPTTRASGSPSCRPTSPTTSPSATPSGSPRAPCRAMRGRAGAMPGDRLHPRDQRPPPPCGEGSGVGVIKHWTPRASLAVSRRRAPACDRASSARWRSGGVRGAGGVCAPRLAGGRDRLSLGARRAQGRPVLRRRGDRLPRARRRGGARRSSSTRRCRRTATA